ncbi:hypothetical protein [uncultured Aquimarina sp.]|uniref:hypothetical protein n=1 Tax=uncultured Aquimarina sp. TaxID=575652 RepID=UPI002603B9AE|nr:hypothetical protein [uncultured Aquimarina sp.]
MITNEKKLFLLLLLPFTLLSQTYNFSYDEDGLIPTNITELNGNIKVFTHPTEGKTMEGKVIASGQTVVANLDLFPNSNNYSITWKETYTTARRSGFILRANGSNSITPGLKKGYLFQANRATNNVRIYKSNSSCFTLLSDKNLTAPGLNSPRWYKASVNGNTLSFYYSTDGVSFINLITTKGLHLYFW